MINISEIKLIPATIEDYPMIQRMWPFYVYDLSRECGFLKDWESPTDPDFLPDDLTHYFTDPKKAFLIKIKNELAGFILIDKLEIMTEIDFYLSEFFILGKFQNKGIGQEVALNLFNQLQGRWAVGVLPENKKAIRFWRKVASEVSGSGYKEIFKTANELRTPEYPEPYAMNIFVFENNNKLTLTNFAIKSEPTIDMVSPDLAEALCRKITAELPEYFGLPEVNEHYAIGVRSRINLAAKLDGEYIGLVSVDFPYPHNANIYWMAVLPEFHRRGIGKILAKSAFHKAQIAGAKTISVETLAQQEADENYLKTYDFYKSLGFEPLFNLKPGGYEWNMVYMIKLLNNQYADVVKDLLIRPLLVDDIAGITQAFKSIDWDKPTALFEEYLKEAEADERVIWLAFIDNRFVGYITLKWHSLYLLFKNQNIPEIMDLNVLPHARKRGVGSMLLDIAEKEAAKRSDFVGIGVGLYGGEDGGYGSAQRLYVKRGYIPDGKGVTYNYESATPGDSYPLDDDLVLWFTKKLK